MNARKQRDKNRRRANKLAQQAWEAAEKQEFGLAVKIIRRAVELNPANPVLWHDQGTLLLQLGQDDQAAGAFEAAIQIAPGFADAQASLAAIRARQQTPRRESTDLASRMELLSWPDVDRDLTHRGVAHLHELLDARECERLRAMFDDNRLFARTVTMNKSRFGKGVYRYFAAPLPCQVDEIRHLVYPHAAVIANRWQGLLKEDEVFPATWPALRNRCAEAGQTTPSPLLLRYEAGGFNAPHQDLRGEVFFPLQMVIVLSSQGEFSGGEFLFCDQPERKPTDRCEIPAGLGDAILFCTRARLVRVGDVYGLKPTKHGLTQVTSGVRYALGIPFHEFTGDTR